MKIDYLKPEQYAEWDAFVAKFPTANIFHLSGWNRIARHYKTENTILAIRDESGAIVAGSPLFVIRRPKSHYVVNGIFGSYTPILGNGGEADTIFFEELKRFTREKKARYFHLKTIEGPTGFRSFQAPEFVRQEVWLSAFLPLIANEEEFWKSLPSTIRTKIRKAQKNDLRIQFGKSDAEFEAFYQVLSDNMLRKGSPIYGREFLRSLLTELPGAEVATLWLGDEAVSGALTVSYNDVIIVPFVSSREKYFPLRPNNLLYWEIMKRAGMNGVKFMDFGTSLKGASTLEFKKSWGSSLVELPSYVYSPTQESIQLDGGQGAVQLGVKIWKKLPPPVAEWLGPKIARLML